ncbi:hypothetical protein D3C75_888250 [compost metagenome]
MFKFSKRAVGGVEKRCTRCGQAHPALVAQKQAETELFLEPVDRLAQRWLRHVQALGGLVKVQLFGHGDELPEQTCFDHPAFLQRGDSAVISMGYQSCMLLILSH